NQPKTWRVSRPLTHERLHEVRRALQDEPAIRFECRWRCFLPGGRVEAEEMHDAAQRAGLGDGFLDETPEVVWASGIDDINAGLKARISISDARSGPRHDAPC